jgi:hypothetical protein
VKSWFKKHTFLTIGIVVVPLAVISGFASGGFGHGNYIVARIVLPFACVFSGMNFGANIIMTFMAFVQWPFYGFLIDMASHKLRRVAIIVVVHTSLCWWLFTKGSEHFQ